MLGSKPRGQFELMMAGSLRDLVPDAHVLARVDRVLDLSWLRAEVRDCYAADGAGRPGIDPEAAVRLMLAGLLLGIVHDRRLLREAQVNIAIRWFAGYGLHEALPDHSSLTRIRQRWGAEFEASELSVPERRRLEREMYKDGLSQAAIADLLGVSQATVSLDLKRIGKA